MCVACCVCVRDLCVRICVSDVISGGSRFVAITLAIRLWWRQHFLPMVRTSSILRGRGTEITKGDEDRGTKFPPYSAPREGEGKTVTKFYKVDILVAVEVHFFSYGTSSERE